MPLIFFAGLAPALAQVGGFGPQAPIPSRPAWMSAFEKLFSPQGHAAPLGSLDQEAEKAWAAALAAGAGHPFFETAAQQAALYFGLQGYDLKAAAILQHAVSAADAVDPTKAASLRLALAQRFNQEQKFLAAARVLEQVLEQMKAASEPAARSTRIAATIQLAQTREQMGEYEAAEALLKKANALRSAAMPETASDAQGVVSARASRMGIASFRMFSGRHGGTADLAGFYQRQGDTAKAEALLKQAVQEAKAPQERFDALQSYVSFLHSQQRWEESASLLEQLIAQQSASAGPEQRPILAGIRQNLAQLLALMGKPEKALDLLRQVVAESANGDIFQRAEALRAYAHMLVQQRRFDEAEKAVEQLRQPGSSARYAQLVADQLLADIRQAQNRPEEPRMFRERVTAAATRPEQGGGTSTPPPVWDLVRPVQEALGRQKYEEGIEQLRRILSSDAAALLRSNPQEIGAFTSLIHQLPEGRQEERVQFMRLMLSALDAVTPADHPRLASALGQVAGSAMHAGLPPAEVTLLLQRQEKILIASKGEDSPALNEVTRLRAQFHAFRGDHADAATEMRHAVERSEASSGDRSQPTLQMMRELTNFLQMTPDNWAEEERVRLALIERSGGLTGFGGFGGSTAQEMSTLASRYFAMGQRENAVAWMDRAIEAARKSPHMAGLVPQFEEQRGHFAHSTAGHPQPAVSPFYGVAPSGRWFDGSGAAAAGSPVRAVTPPPPPAPVR